MDYAATDVALGRMFAARRLVLRAGAIFVGLLFVAYVNSRLSLFTDRGETLLVGVGCVLVLFMIVGSLVTACYVFSASQEELGAGYAFGHALLCLGLATVMLLGIMIVPLLVRREIERSRWESTDQDGYGQI